MFDINRLRTSETRLRIISSLVLAPLVLLAVYLGNGIYDALVMIVATRGLYEWLRLVDPKAPEMDTYVMHGCMLLCLLFASEEIFILSFIAILMAGVVFFARRDNASPDTAIWFGLGLPYIGGSSVALLALRAHQPMGMAMTYFLLAVVWGTDIGAYIVGRIVGGPKLAPTISPNKTWAGFVGGIAFALGFGYLVLKLTNAYSYFDGVVVAVILSVVAQMGDLFKSFFKRRAGVKDSGNVIPGHGGVLDRIDGLIFAAYLLEALQMFLGRSLMW